MTVTSIKPKPKAQHAEDGYFISGERMGELFPGYSPQDQRRQLRNALIDLRDDTPRRRPTPRPPEVRAARESDEEALVALILNDLEEAGAASIAPVDPERVRMHIEACTRGRGGLAGVIDDPAGKPIAVVVLIPSQWAWSQAWYLQDIWSYVHPDHRGSSYGKKLIEFAFWASDEWTRQFGYEVPVLTGVLALKRAREKFRMFRRMAKMIGIAVLYPAPPE